MRLSIAYTHIALLLILLFTALPAYTQVGEVVKMPLNGYSENPPLDISVENALDYRYQARDWSMPRYSAADSLTFADRFYFNLGYGINRSWDSLSGDGENSIIFGAGYNFTPVHSMELGVDYNKIATSITTAYYMNLNNAALRRNANHRFEVLLGTGADIKLAGGDIAAGFSTSLRGRYNVTRNLALYVEPTASFSSPLRSMQSGAQVATSLRFGVNYKFGKPEFYVSDYVLPRALRNPIRLDVPYEFDNVPLFALKTNLLFDLATAINVAVEVPIGNRWSVNGEWMFPWWSKDDGTQVFQLLSGHLEGRYWLGEREDKKVLTGFFAGFYVGGGLYDLRYNSNGYQGEFYIASGLSAGYAHPLNRKGSLRMEYALGVGYLSTDYRYYEGRADNRFMVWQYNGRYTWFGPTRASASLVWMWNINKKRGGKQ